MPVPTVNIDSYSYPVYADQPAADSYLEAAIHGDSWTTLDVTKKAKSLATSTRVLDRQPWPGTKTDPAQDLQWPRTNTGIVGVDANTVPLAIINASIELALALEEGSTVQTQQNTAERLRSMSAGSVSITNFRGIDTPTRFPLIVQELIAPYLGINSQNYGAKITGVDKETIFPVELGYNLGGF
jgi:hypothetical protein